MSKDLRTSCSNCMGPLMLNVREGTVTASFPASGRGSKRTPARTAVSVLTEVDAGFYQWTAPCCPDYEDSLDIYA